MAGPIRAIIVDDESLDLFLFAGDTPAEAIKKVLAARDVLV